MTDSTVTALLYRLAWDDLRDFARTLSCIQDIADDRAFNLGMLARFEPTLREHGADAHRESTGGSVEDLRLRTAPPYAQLAHDTP